MDGFGERSVLDSPLVYEPFRFLKPIRGNSRGWVDVSMRQTLLSRCQVQIRTVIPNEAVGCAAFFMVFFSWQTSKKVFRWT